MTYMEDPREGYRGFSVFPRTLACISNHPQPCDLGNPRSIHNFLKSLPVRNPDKLLEQAKTTLDNTTDIPSAKMTNVIMLKDKNDVGAAKAVDHPRGQRPGLGRKRPGFSLLPNISHPTVDLEPTLDFDKLKDPEDFFLAYERLERELGWESTNISIQPCLLKKPLKETFSLVVVTTRTSTSRLSNRTSKCSITTTGSNK